MEAYPTLKTRIGLPSISLPPMLVAVSAVVLAAVALFFLPALLGIGNPSGTGSSPSPSAGASTAASGSPGPATPTPGPTQQVYVVQEGDTMSRIANRFGVTLDALIEANRETVPNPDIVEIGQEVIIPAVAPTSLPDAGASPSPS
jgi:LysM repeat protein